MIARKVNPAEKGLRMSLLAGLKDKLGGWRKDAAASQVKKMRGASTPAKPVEVTVEKVEETPVKPFAKGGVVESEEADKDTPRSEGEPSIEEEAEFGDKSESDFPEASDDDTSDVEVEEAVDGKDADGYKSFEDLLRSLNVAR